MIPSVSTHKIFLDMSEYFVPFLNFCRYTEIHFRAIALRILLHILVVIELNLAYLFLNDVNPSQACVNA